MEKPVVREENILMKGKLKTIILNKFPKNIISIKKICCCKKRKAREPKGFLEFKTMLIELKYFKTLIVVEIKLFIKKMNKRIVLVEDLVTSRKISQNEKQRKTHKEIKQVEDGCETVFGYYW